LSPNVRRGVLLGVLFLGGGALAGGLFGGVNAQSDKASNPLRNFGRILALVEDNYVGKGDAEALVGNSIQGMLRTLDPHSNYLDPENYTEMRDEQRGKFYGLGIQITKRGPDKPLTIIAPIDGTPAQKAGLQAGDIIAKIEGDDTIALTVQQAVRRLKGDRGTKVTISIQRPGEANAFDVTLVRDEIPTHSVPVAFMVDGTVGLVRISNFTSTTANELDQAVSRLRAQGMERLILDLRSNPGGLLEQAVAVSERFVPAGKMVVYTRGRIAGSDQDYLASKGAPRIDAPLVVLVDHSSASASEIVSGAIQDHDRGLVIGETTFGKGLVQRVIPLRDGGALALTTAKYYTPSGRLIQRDYSDLDDYFDPEFSEDAESPAPAPEPTDREVRQTDAGRTVYGGGGITPDYVVKQEKAPILLSRLLRDNLFFDFSVRFAAKNPELARTFSADDKVLQEFRDFIRARKFEYEESAFESAKDLIGLRLRAQVARVKWGPEAESLIFAQADPVVRKALGVFDEAARLSAAGEESRREKERESAQNRPKS
jgi:carboxyl-terminal processing protease